MSTEIPPGVYYHIQADNFYDARAKMGMGHDFHVAWHARRLEFPSTADEALRRSDRHPFDGYQWLVGGQTVEIRTLDREQLIRALGTAIDLLEKVDEQKAAITGTMRMFRNGERPPG